MNTTIYQAFAIIGSKLIGQIIFFIVIFGLGRIFKYHTLSLKQYFLNKYFLMMFALAFVWSVIPITIIDILLTVMTTWYMEKKIIEFNYYKSMMF